MAKSSQQKYSLRLAAEFLQAGSEDRRPAVAAYAYSQGGQLLAHADLDAKGKGQLDFAAAAAPTAVRVVLGPAPEGKQPSAPDELLRRGAMEQHLRLDSRETQVVNFQVYPDVWRYWLLGLCLVKGTVLKRVVRDGVSIDFPVCRATVEIYEVDPLWIVLPKLPADVLAHLREILAGTQPPLPLPGPGPVEIGIASTHRIDAPALAALHAASGNALRFAAISGSTQAFQQALIDHAALIRPLLCWLYPRFVTMQLIGTASTDECGHFRRYIFKSFNNPDQPDLYFKVTQRLFGFLDVTIYAPTPVACHTWWNYACGSEVTLYTTHPLAITCKPCLPVIAGNNWVLFMAVGNFPLSRIHGSGASLQGATNPTNLGLTDGGAPWGGTLRPRLEFDSALRDGLGVTYYRLSWKRDAEPATAYRPLIAAINRHYAHMVGTDLVLDAYQLGPQTKGSESALFEIPPTLPPAGQWSIADAVADTASGAFDTVAADGTPLLDGKVQLRVELFDAAGAPVDVATLGIDYYVPTSTDLSGTVQTEKASLLGLVSGNSMVITLHANNEQCTAGIDPPTIGASSADACCGTLVYDPGDNVSMSWQAAHPHGYASYNFGVVRGAQGVYSASGPVGAGSFSASRSVEQLLNDNLPAGCVEDGCTVAGFGENVYVIAAATDGWSRQSQYDASGTRAFVLKPA